MQSLILFHCIRCFLNNFQAEFVLTDYKHSNGTTVKIIKDWKEALNSVYALMFLLHKTHWAGYANMFIYILVPFNYQSI